MFRTLSLLLLVYLANSSELNLHNNTVAVTESLETLEKIYGNILCRSCGNEVASSNDLISKLSPYSTYSFKDMIFDKSEILVQVLSGDYILDHPVIITSASNCAGVQEWQESGTWFPGYRWKHCVCPDCGEYIGRVFEAVNPLIETPSSFFGLILSSLISESFVSSLTVLPGGLSN